MHATPLHHKPGTMRRWLEEDHRGINITGIPWLLKENRLEGKTASSLVKYEIRGGSGEGKYFRTSEYDLDRSAARRAPQMARSAIV